MTELEARLLDLGQHLDVPADERVTALVMASVRASSPRRRTPTTRRRVVAAVVVAALSAVAATVAPAVADWWSIRTGGVEVRHQPATTVPPAPDLGLGVRVGLADAVRQVPFVVKQLPGSPPNAIWLDHLDGIAVVSMTYRGSAGGSSSARNAGVDILFQQFASPLSDPALMTKFAGPATTVEEVGVGSWHGVWIESGHGIALRRGGNPLFVPSRLAGNTLAWDVNGVTFRIEGDLRKEEALRLAEHLR
jgi:hypothetical protein